MKSIKLSLDQAGFTQHAKNIAEDLYLKNSLEFFSAAAFLKKEDRIEGAYITLLGLGFELLIKHRMMVFYGTVNRKEIQTIHTIQDLFTLVNLLNLAAPESVVELSNDEIVAINELDSFYDKPYASRYPTLLNTIVYKLSEERYKSLLCARDKMLIKWVGISKKMNDEVIAKGKLFELVHFVQDDGRIFEVARRAPGVRIIIPDKQQEKILLTREFRSELQGWDYRLPGGKVFDTLDDYEACRSSGGDLLEAAKLKAKAEGAEEAGIDVQEVELYKKSTLGATVEWDLYIFEATKWQVHTDGQRLEHGEQIETDNWFTFAEVERMIIEGDMQEERIALILLQWIKRQ